MIRLLFAELVAKEDEVKRKRRSVRNFCEVSDSKGMQRLISSSFLLF